MSVKTVLFVGGPFHGMEWEVRESCHFVLIVRPKTNNIFGSSTPQLYPDEPDEVLYVMTPEDECIFTYYTN